MAGTVAGPPAFESVVRDFIEEQLAREPFCTVGTVADQLSPLQEKVRVLGEKLVRRSAA